MIRNLKEQTLKNAEQDWLKTNLARFSRMLQGERDLATVSNLIMSELAPLVNAQYGVFYVTKREEDETKLELVASYGAESPDELQAASSSLREGLIGQAAADKRPILLEGRAAATSSASARASAMPTPANVNILPALFEDEVKAVIELASFNEFNETHQSFLDQLMESVGIVLNTIAATMRTEGLLKQSQLLTAGAAGAPDRAHHASRRSCTRPTRSCRKRRSCSRTRRSRSKPRISKSKWRAARSRRRPSSSR